MQTFAWQKYKMMLTMLGNDDISIMRRLRATWVSNRTVHDGSGLHTTPDKQRDCNLGHGLLGLGCCPLEGCQAVTASVYDLAEVFSGLCGFLMRGTFHKGELAAKVVFEWLKFGYSSIAAGGSVSELPNRVGKQWDLSNVHEKVAGLGHEAGLSHHQAQPPTFTLWNRE